MTRQTKAAHAEGQGGQSKTENTYSANCTSVKPSQLLRPLDHGSKIYAVLNYFVFTCSLNRFEASRILYDTALNSTISDLANGYGIVFDKHWEKVPNRAGGMTRVRRYSLASESAINALKLLNFREV